MAPIEASHICEQCGYSVRFLPARAGRPEAQWLVRNAADWAAYTLPAGGRFTASQLVAFAAALP